jgi:hypothetical protein
VVALGAPKTPAMTYSRTSRHYHRPRMLNGRVRNGNGCIHPGMFTEEVGAAIALPLLAGSATPRYINKAAVRVLRSARALQASNEAGPSEGSMRSSVRLLVPVS